MDKVLTNTLRGFTNKFFEQNYKFTIGVDIFSQEVTLNSGAETIYLSIWDINRTDKFSMFRPNFYAGSVGGLILIDFDDRYSLLIAKQLIEEIRMSCGNVPIFIYGMNSNGNISTKMIQEEIEDLNCINIELYDIKSIWVQLANKMFEITTGKSITNPQYRAYVENFKKSKNFLHMILKGMGYKIQGENVDILNKHGIFSVNLNSGKTHFEALKCSDCKNRFTCKKKSKKFICIVQRFQDFRGWSNSELLSDDILVLSKIFAISEDVIPEDVHSQMDEIIACSAL